MNRKFSRCGNNGLNSRTCNEKRLKLFGGRSLGEGDDITRKSKSRGNISFYLNSSNGSKKMAISMVSSTEEHDTRNQAMNGAPLYIYRDCSISNSWNTNFSEGAFNSSRNLLGYLVGSVEISVVGEWRYMYSFSPPIAALMGLGMWSLPPSPRWLLLRALQGKATT